MIGWNEEIKKSVLLPYMLNNNINLFFEKYYSSID